MTERQTIATELRRQAGLCQTANSAAMLCEFAAWIEGGTVFDGERQELWQHADRMCKCPHCGTCPKCGGLVITLDEKTTLCGCSYVMDVSTPFLQGDIAGSVTP